MIRVAAHAKVNLYLHVVGRRADGYHLLDSLAVFADLADTVTAEAADELSLSLDGPFSEALAKEADNLVLRAARAMAEAYRRPPKARLTLTKRIPVAAGLGGGSADAAATLLALAQLWDVEVPDGLALALGADVPVCLGRRAAFMSGIGEQLVATPALPPAYLLLVNPGVAVATADVFRARSGGFSKPAPFAVTPMDTERLGEILRPHRNDLTVAATSLAPAIADARSLVQATHGCLLARMSGSGASVFGLYASEDDAARAADSIAHKRPAWWTWSGAMIGEIDDD